MTGIALAVYLATLAPDLTFMHWSSDGGDLLGAARTLGVPHPPGFPSYTLLAWLATRVPIGSIAYRGNLLSAMSAACAIGLLFMAFHSSLPRDRLRWLPALVGALTLGFAPLVWSQAVVTEVYAPALCFIALALFLALRWRSGGPDTLLWLAALVLGLGMGIHLTLVFTIPPAAILLWPQRRRWWQVRTALPVISLFAIGLAIYAYLPLAASRHPPVNWGAPDSWERFLWMISAKLYQPMVLGIPPSDIALRLYKGGEVVLAQFGWHGWGLAFVGLLVTSKRDRALGIGSALWLATVAAFASLYNSSDSIVYVLPALVAPALWLCEGTSNLLKLVNRLPRRAATSLSMLLLLLPAASLARHWTEVDLSRDRSGKEYVDRLLAEIGTDGIALVQGDRPTFALWYALYAEQQRPDIVVVNTSLLGFDWYREQMHWTYPQLVVPEPASPQDSIHELVREMVILNYLNRPVYALDPSDEWRTWFDIAETGDALVYRIQVQTKWEQAQ